MDKKKKTKEKKTTTIYIVIFIVDPFLYFSLSIFCNSDMTQNNIFSSWMFVKYFNGEKKLYEKFGAILITVTIIMTYSD